MTRQVATMRIGVATVLHAARTILLGVAKLLFVVRPVVGFLQIFEKLKFSL